MRLQDYYFELPKELIAQEPLSERSASRLLCIDPLTGKCHDRLFVSLRDELVAGDLIIFNDTRVIPARLYGQKPTGGRVELMLERILDEHIVLAQLRVNKTPRIGSELIFDGGLRLKVLARSGEFFKLEVVGQSSFEKALDDFGHTPLPPYISRPDSSQDRLRYQTVYAKQPGAVAAPTAGLHFDEEFLRNLAASGINIGFVTLHVGAGTFQPVRVDDLATHKMHSEHVHVSQKLCDDIIRCREQGGRIVAVGTTTVRSLETAAQDGELSPFQGDTDLFITQGFDFKVVDALITNFHLPESTLLMLVCAFGGYDHIMHAYRHAIENQYRFYSYGDAMLIHRQQMQT